MIGQKDNDKISGGYIRNKFLLTAICCLICHWSEVSPEVDTSRARSASDNFTDD